MRAGLTGRRMAAVLDVSQAQLYRYDHAVTTPTVPQVRAWLDACRAEDRESVTPEDRVRIVELAEAAHAEPKTWKAMRDAGITSAQEAAADQDADAVAVWEAECVVLPGLLQTPEYAAAAVRQADLHDQFDHAAQLAGRLARQARLYEPGREWRFLIAERLLTESPGVPALLGPQRARLRSLADVDGVEVAVLPTAAVIRPSGLWWAPFTIIQPKDGDRYVSVEMPHGEITVTTADEVASYELLWERLWSAAWTGDDARVVLDRIPCRELNALHREGDERRDALTAHGSAWHPEFPDAPQLR